MSQDIDDTRMTATREHNKSLVLEMTDDSLVVPNPGVGFPFTVRPRLLEGKAFLEIRHALDLSGHQDHAVKQECRAALLDDRDTFAVQVIVARWRHMDVDACRQYD